MKAFTLPDAVALGAAHGAELELESRRGVSAAPMDHGNVGPGGGWSSTLQTIDAVFCRSFPDLSRFLYYLLGENAIDELDD